MPNMLRAILWGGMLCGIFDFAAVTSLYALKGVPPLRVWQAVGSGLLGPTAFQQGWTSGAVGLLAHSLISFTAAAVFFLASRQVPVLRQRYLISGALYGVAVFLFMNLVVVPLSAMPKKPVPAGLVVAQLMIHILFVGLPISLSAYRFSTLQAAVRILKVPLRSEGQEGRNSVQCDTRCDELVPEGSNRDTRKGRARK